MVGFDFKVVGGGGAMLETGRGVVTAGVELIIFVVDSGTSACSCPCDVCTWMVIRKFMMIHCTCLVIRIFIMKDVSTSKILLLHRINSESLK